MTDDAIPDAELDAIVAQLAQAVLGETYATEDGKEAHRRRDPAGRRGRRGR